MYRCVLCNFNKASMSTEASTVTTSVSGKECSKCGNTKTSGKLSCCARGGTWFKKCGDAGDTKFDHSWVEGIQACAGFASLFPSKPQVLLRHEQLNATRNQNDLLQKFFDFTDDNASSMGTESYSYKGVCVLLKVIIFMNIVL